MSHSIGKVRFKNDKILYYEYNGTCDVVINHLYETEAEVNKNWRNHKTVFCNCGKDEPVEIATSYGGGFSWDGRACRKCMTITAGLGSGVEDDPNFQWGLPDWYRETDENN